MARRRGRGSNSSKLEMERRFPYHVDVPVPACGLGQQLNDLLDWCGEHADEWNHHSHTERGEIGERFRYFARFYFMTEEDAEAFIQEWLDEG